MKKSKRSMGASKGRASRSPAITTPRVERKSKGAGTSLMLMVPPDTLRALRVRAAETGTTVRALVLEALLKAGYEVPAEELIDRRRRT